MLDRIIDAFVDRYGVDNATYLMKIIAPPSSGGLGYRIALRDIRDLDGWDVETGSKTIVLDTKGLFSDRSPRDVAENLLEAVETDFLRSRASLLSRVGWGTGKVVLGVIETGVGLVGILVPEPGTTAAGVVVVTLGANTVVDGFTQLAGANRGQGVNILGEGAGALGARAAAALGRDPQTGRAIGEGAFVVTSIALGSIGSIRILNIRRATAFRLGVGGRPGGASIGRLDVLYPSSRARDGMTLFNVNDNAGNSILRFVTHSGRLVVNGRIYGVQRVLRHEGDPVAVVKGLLKLLAHGGRNGW